MSIQVLPQKYNPGSRIGQALGMGLVQGTERAAQADFTKGRLQEAFDKLKPGGNYIDQLKAVAPDLLSTPGGAQALSELASVFASQSKNTAIQNAINNRRGGGTGSQPVPMQDQQQMNSDQSQQMNPGKQGEVIPQGQDYFLNPKAPKGAESLYPQRSTSGITQELSEPEMESMALDIMDQSNALGKPISFAEAMQVPMNLNNQRRSQNDVVRGEQKAQQQQQQILSSGMVARAEDKGMLDFPGSRTIAEKSAYEAREGRTEPEIWDYVQSKLKEGNNHYNAIIRDTIPGNPLSSFARYISGSQKSNQQVMRDLQPHIDYYKNMGLFDELRDLLVNQTGFNAEDAETAMFYPSKSEWSAMNNFPKNPKKVQADKPLFNDVAINDLFPDQRYEADPKTYQTLKTGVVDYLKRHPEANLLALRGQLNRDKNYYWGDISKVFSQILAENRMVKGAWQPNQAQLGQLNVLNHAPLPGLSQQFKFLWTGSK